MTEKSYLFSTNGTGDGASPYTQLEWSTIVNVLTASAGGGYEGVLPNYDLQMEGFVVGVNSVGIAMGAAIVDGKVYTTTVGSVVVTIPSAVGVGNTRIDRIVLRANWTAQTVRITRIAGTDDVSPTPPAITQISGTTYDIYLYQVLVDTGGNLTLTDERSFINVLRRQGGGTTDWSTAGTTNYIPDATKMEAGCVTWTGGAAATGSVTITFPKAFSDKPLIYVTAAAISDAGVVGVVGVAASKSQATLTWYASVNQTAVSINWLAIGPR